MNGGLIALFAVVAIAIAAGSWWLKQRRREDLARAAGKLGLAYSQQDTSDAVTLPFALFRRGDGRGTENLLHGVWQGIPVREFDFWFYEESTDAQGHRTRSYSRFSCAVTEVDLAMPAITVARENLFTRLADALGLDDITYELEEFNEAFNVKAQDRRFANDLVDQRMMRWLLGVEDGLAFEASGRWLLAYGRRRDPFDLVPLLAALRGFRDRIPRVVHDLYGSASGGELGLARTDPDA